MPGLHADPAMTSGAGAAGPLLAADGRPLKVSLARALRRNKFKAFLLVSPLLLFLALAFVMPIVSMLTRSVHAPEIANALPNTVEAIADWDGEGLPDEAVFAAFATDLKAGLEARNLGEMSSRLNYERSGMRSTVMSTARRIANQEPEVWKDTLIGINKEWGERDVWRLIQREASSITWTYYLAALDLRYSPDGKVVAAPEEQQIYIKLFVRTLWMSVLITGLCMVLGYPIAFLLASLPLRTSNLLMMLVLLPFWTSLLVRITTWIAILQSQGVINNSLVGLGIIDDAARLQMIYNQTGTIVAMTHILLPFMILPLYSVMKTISPAYMRAARSMGASGFYAFRRVYFPQTLPGIGAGGILVFILSIGYYITPALVGGETGRFITNFIAYHMQVSLNWGLAAAIASILLAMVTVLYFIYNRVVGANGLKLG